MEKRELYLSIQQKLTEFNLTLKSYNKYVLTKDYKLIKIQDLKNQLVFGRVSLLNEDIPESLEGFREWKRRLIKDRSKLRKKYKWGRNGIDWVMD